MKKKTLLGMASVVLASGLILAGCGKDNSDKGSASFKVQLKDATNALASANPSILAAATSLKVKLGGVDLLSDCTGGNPPGTCLDDDRQPDPDIWVNAGCNNDIAQCTTTNTEFFELINPTAANAELNSQGRSIEAGTFTHVRIYILNNDLNDALECNGAASAVRPGVPITIALPTALTVADGESVTVTLNYDPSAVDCADDSSIGGALNAITATVAKN